MTIKLSKIVIVGLGLIGGSLAKALQNNRAQVGSDDGRFLVGEIVGCGRTENTLKQALELGLIDSYSLDLAQASADADLVLLAAPIGSTERLLKEIAKTWNGKTIVTDAGSAKSCVLDAAESAFGRLPPQLVPGHPIAGSEKSGVTAADGALYENHTVILTPHGQGDASALHIVTQLWESVGAHVITMDADHHDQVLAATSHLPHLLAFSLVDTLAGDPDNREIFQYAAGGFRDFTRIAASDPTMWHDVFAANRSATLKALDNFSEGLMEFRCALADGDSSKVLSIISRAKSAREQFSQVLEERATHKPN